MKAIATYPLLCPLLVTIAATVMPMGVQVAVTYLWCIIINKRLEVLTKPFQLLLPLSVGCDMIFAHLRITAPSLRGKDPSMFSLHKPLSDISKDEHPGQLTTSVVQVDCWSCVEPTAQIKSEFPTVRKDEGLHVDVIICVDVDNAGGYFSYYQLINILILSHRSDYIGLTSIVWSYRSCHDKIGSGS